MAYNVQKINPLDLQPRKAIGINLPLSGTSVLDSTYQSKDAIKANIVNLLLTGKGERPLNPNLGSPLRDFLFENITESKLREIKVELTNILNVYFPDISVTQLDILSQPDQKVIVVYLRYSVVNTNIEDEIQLNVEQ